ATIRKQKTLATARVFCFLILSRFFTDSPAIRDRATVAPPAEPRAWRRRRAEGGPDRSCGERRLHANRGPTAKGPRWHFVSRLPSTTASRLRRNPARPCCLRDSAGRAADRKRRSRRLPAPAAMVGRRAAEISGKPAAIHPAPLRDHGPQWPNSGPRAFWAPPKSLLAD